MCAKLITHQQEGANMRWITALIIALALTFTGAATAQAAVSIPTKSDGRPAFSAKTKAKLATTAEAKRVSSRAKKYGSPKKFEYDIRGCEIQYKVRTVKQSDCINLSIRVHKQFY